VHAARSSVLVPFAQDGCALLRVKSPVIAGALIMVVELALLLTMLPGPFISMGALRTTFIRVVSFCATLKSGTIMAAISDLVRM
jgi:hypothetical protein